MRVNDDHMYHGAALTQIAEHRQFTSINAVRVGGVVSRSAFRINETIGVYLKYATRTNSPSGDYVFTFARPNKVELRSLSRRCDDVYIALVCVHEREICCISHGELLAWFDRRRDALGRTEQVSTILVRLPSRKSFRVNMNRPGRRGVYLSQPQLVPRNRFPGALFA